MKKIKIDVVVVPLSGHLFPTLNLLKPLLENPLYDIRIFTGPQRQQVTENLGFKVVPILENHLDAFEKVSNNSKKLNIFDAYRQLSNSLELINIVSDQLIEEWCKNRPDIVIADFITLSGGLIAEQLQIPWITTMATQFAIETTDGPPIFFGGIRTPKNSVQVIQQSLGRRITRLGKRVVAFSLREKLKGYNFTLYNQNNQETIYSPYSILGIRMKELEIKSGFPNHYYWVGPSGYSVDKVEDYPLDLSPYQGSKKVLVTCGTQLPWAKDNLIYQTKQLAKHYPNYQFFVTLGNSKLGFQCMELTDNVSVVSYLPYQAYIPKMDYVIHHGGAGIFYQSIIFGKPSLILPHDYDQFDYAVRGAEAGVALTAKRNDTNAIKQAFDKMIKKENWEEIEKLKEVATNYKPTEILEREIHRLLNDVKNKKI